VFSATQFDGLGLAEGVTVWQQLGVQALGAVATLVWCAVLTFALLKLVGLVVPLRVSAEAETEGLDLALHDERGYSA
jgi:Amt family ammonium transporter